VGAKVEQKAIRQITKIIAEKKASWPSEISAFTDYDQNTVGQACRKLTEAGILSKLRPKIKGSDPRLVKRSFSVNGGIQAMRSRDWYALNSDKTWRMKLWNQDRVIDEYGRDLYNPETGIIYETHEKEKIHCIVVCDEKIEDHISHTVQHDAVEALEDRRLI